MISNDLTGQLKISPQKPGVYLMKDLGNAVLYIGKAKNLKKRLQSYFGPSRHSDFRIRNMVRLIKDFEFIVTASEEDALILENTLIKKYKPKYNARLKDDKTYPYLKVDINEPFPQVYITRRIENDGARYFGPYSNAKSVRMAMNVLKRLFPYRSCTKEITGNDSRPCLEYYIGRCVAPCTGKASQEEYSKVIQQAIMFMEGHADYVITDLKDKMREASYRLEFEKAALLRDQITSVSHVTKSRNMISKGASQNAKDNQDIIASATLDDTALVEVFFVRNGILTGREHYAMEGVVYESQSTVLANFLKQYYQFATFVPSTIVIERNVDDQQLIQDWMSQKHDKNVRLQIPIKGRKKALIDMAHENAEQGLEQLRVKWLSKQKSLEEALEELQESLNLPRIPARMECYDISNIQGTYSVGSMVVFDDGKPKPKDYRRFKIKMVEKIDDYAMMKEMLKRRFRRISADLAKKNYSDSLILDEPSNNRSDVVWNLLPDLVLIDGGKGHLNAASEVFLELGISDIPLASIAKQNEEIFVRGIHESVILPRNSPALFMIQRLRDEAHRFAITYHRLNRSKNTIKSILDDITGIGPKRRKVLFDKFYSIEGIKNASQDEISSTVGISLSLSKRIKDFLTE